VTDAELAELEAELDARCTARSFEGAATLAIRGFGPQIVGFLQALLRDEDLTSDVFAEVCEDLWRGLPGFERRAPFRSWLYTLARHAAWRRLRREKQARRHVALDDASLVSRLQQEVRLATLPHLRSETRTRFTALRESLPIEDQELLILRVDKRLDWKELARILGGEQLDESELTRTASRLRKRFQVLKERLRERARKEGWLEKD
jgi:RNA polymerase sigma-70 factor (ECF subfamily)